MLFLWRVPIRKSRTFFPVPSLHPQRVQGYGSTLEAEFCLLGKYWLTCIHCARSSHWRGLYLRVSVGCLPSILATSRECLLYKQNNPLRSATIILNRLSRSCHPFCICWTHALFAYSIVGLLKFDSPLLVTHASIQIYSLTNVVSTGLFEMTVGVLTTCHTLETGVCSCTDGSRNSQSFLLWCAVCSSFVFLRLERSLLRWRRTAVRRRFVCLHFIIVLMFVESQRVHV